jgi:thiol-disulfide isomerase/thioredoxin
VRRLAALTLLLGAVAWAAPTDLLPYDENVHQKLIAGSKGQVLLIDFWATWCSPCLEEIPHLVALERKYRGKGLRLVTVSADDEEDRAAALKFLQEKRVPAPVYLKTAGDDDKFITFVDKTWSGALPALFLYDRNGKLARTFIGEADMKAVEKAIQGLL